MLIIISIPIEVTLVGIVMFVILLYINALPPCNNNNNNNNNNKMYEYKINITINVTITNYNNWICMKLPIEVTDEGITIEDSLFADWKAWSPILVTLVGKLILRSCPQLWNARLSITVTPYGILTDSKAVEESA